jgi:uncharacterized protein (DUF1015 family)
MLLMAIIELLQAAGVGKERREANQHHTGNEAYNFFLAVHFPDNQLAIMDYKPCSSRFKRTVRC